MKKRKLTLKWLIRLLIILIPYFIHYVRLFIQLLDEYTQLNTFKLLSHLDLLEKSEPEKEVLI